MYYKVLLYEKFFDIFEPNFCQKSLHLPYMDCDSFDISNRTQNKFSDLENLEDIFEFINLNKDHELFNNKNKTVVGKFKKETPKKIG